MGLSCHMDKFFSGLKKVNLSGKALPQQVRGRGKRATVVSKGKAAGHRIQVIRQGKFSSPANSAVKYIVRPILMSFHLTLVSISPLVDKLEGRKSLPAKVFQLLQLLSFSFQ